MYYRTLGWWRRLSPLRKVLWWPILAVVALASIALFFLPWIISPQARNKIQATKAKFFVDEFKIKMKQNKDIIERFEKRRTDKISSQHKRVVEVERILNEIKRIEMKLGTYQSKE